MEKKRCDLHTHSTYSDGTYTPEELIREAVRCNLAAVALSDHNTLAGVPEFVEAAKGMPVEAVPGIEMSVGYNGKEIHVLGLFIQEQHYDDVRDFLKKVNEIKMKSNRELYQNLKKGGYDISYDRIRESAGDGSMNRVHFAMELVHCGYAADVAEAFRNILSEKHGFYNPPPRVGGYEAVQFLSSIGAVPVLAHPFLNLTMEELHDFLPKAKACGLIGMETDYSLFDEEQTKAAVALVSQYGLLRSGGSDFHGDNKPHISMGIGKGNLCVPEAFYTALKEKAGNS